MQKMLCVEDEMEIAMLSAPAKAVDMPPTLSIRL
jgi:hypothetical protein